ncbi:MAG: hypothetical protein WD844_04085 [Thermoleophilaceae bacterium]
MNPSHLTTSAVKSHVDEARRRADASRRAGEARSLRRGLARPAPVDPAAYSEHVVIRSAGPWDDAALVRLAELDSSRLPRGEKLVAEVRGELIAAVGMADGRAVADPFRSTADVVGLLRMRAGQLRALPGGNGSGGAAAVVRDRLRAVMRQRHGSMNVPEYPL